MRGLALLAAPWLAMGLSGAFWLTSTDHPRVVATMLVLALPYAAGTWWVLKQAHALDGTRALVVILGTAALARVALLPWPPVSTDIYRYVWDGRVQAAGVNPYRYVPADPALAPLRDAAIYPQVNRAATAVTIYPPAAEMVFWAATRIDETVSAMKIAVVLFEAAGIAALLRLLRARGLPPARILIYAWHPVPLFEFAGSGHIDAVAIAFLLLSFWAADRNRPILAGIMLGAGAGTKYFPAFVAPALYRPWDWRMPAGFAATLVLLYLPYLGVGRGVLGFLPGYVDEEGISSGGIAWLALIGRISPLPASAPVVYLALAGAALIGLGLAILWRRRAEPPSPSAALLLLGTFTVAVTPHYAWYYAWTVPFLCFRPSLALMWLTAASPLLYGMVWPLNIVHAEIALFVPFLVIFLVERLWPRDPSSDPEHRDVSRVERQPAA